MFRLFLLLLVSLCVVVPSCTAKSSSKVLTRKRRYIGFPEGSSFSIKQFLRLATSNTEKNMLQNSSFLKYLPTRIFWRVDDRDSALQCAGCVTVGTLGNPSPSMFPGIFTFGLNWGIAYELPNATETALFHRKRYSKPAAQRRSRRELYHKVEVILDKMGYNGRQCILKTLCETTQRISPHSDNIVEEIFRTLFTLPMTKVFSSEPQEHAVYDAAYRLGMIDSCDRYRCPLSLVDWALGYYNTPSPDLSLYENPLTILRSSFDYE